MNRYKYAMMRAKRRSYIGEERVSGGSVHEDSHHDMVSYR